MKGRVFASWGLASVAVLMLTGLAWWFRPYGSSQSPLSTAVQAQYSDQVISAGDEQKISLTLTAAVPELEDVDYQLMRSGKMSVVGTAALDGYGDRYTLAADMTARFFETVYRDSPVPVAYAALYATYQGRYVMAAGLGRQAAAELALTTLGADQGVQLVEQLARLGQSGGTPSTQAFAEYRQP